MLTVRSEKISFSWMVNCFRCGKDQNTNIEMQYKRVTFCVWPFSTIRLHANGSHRSLNWSFLLPPHKPRIPIFPQRGATANRISFTSRPTWWQKTPRNLVDFILVFFFILVEANNDGAEANNDGDNDIE